MNNTLKVITIILGGGRGTRLFPLTERRAKPAVPIGGKYRLIDTTLSNSINSGYRWIYVLTQYASDSLIRHIQETYTFGTFVRGHVQILAAQQTMDSSVWYQGTADAVRRNMSRFRAQRPDLYLILSGDHLYRMDYRDLVDFHVEQGFDLTIGVTPVPRSQARHFGIMRLDGECRVADFFEKPSTGDAIEALAVDSKVKSRLALDEEDECLAGSMGVYVFSSGALEASIEARPGMNDFGSEIIPSALKFFKVGGYMFKEYWRDIGTIKSYYEASLEFAGPSGFPFSHPTFPIYTHKRYLAATRIRNADIESSLVSEGASIEQSKITRSIIGIRSVIGPGTEITDSIIMGNDYYETEMAEIDRRPLGIGAGTRLKGVIADKNVSIGERCELVNARGVTHEDGRFHYIRDGIIVVPKNVVVPPGTRV